MHDRVGTYSQGMRQRLGIAMALLPKPRLVLLDEPTNGLDPHGINHIRGVIQRLNREEGVTFLLSSHLLHEVEITCTRVGILKRGRLVLQDALSKIMAATVDGVRISAEPLDRARDLLKAVPGVTRVADDPAGRLRVHCPAAAIPELNALLLRNGVTVSELTPARRTLEEFFLAQ
jgi:ABC-2 type transport system ATP-binding protein